MGTRSFPRELVTGGAGFIGRRLARALPAAGRDMVTAARRVTGAPVPATRVPPAPGEMPAVVVDAPAARELRYGPAYDLDSGLATVRPGFTPRNVLAAAEATG